MTKDIAYLWYDAVINAPIKRYVNNVKMMLHANKICWTSTRTLCHVSLVNSHIYGFRTLIVAYIFFHQYAKTVCHIYNEYLNPSYSVHYSITGSFYNGDSYIILNTYKDADGEELKYDVHFWIGEYSTQDPKLGSFYRITPCITPARGIVSGSPL